MPNFLLGGVIELRSLIDGTTMKPPLPKLSICVGLVAPLAGEIKSNNLICALVTE